MDQQARTPALAELETRLLSRWPDHARYLAKSLDGRAAPVAAVTEQLANAVLTLGAAMDHGLEGLIDDYRFLCETIVLPEELYFRRNGAYRLSRFGTRS